MFPDNKPIFIAGPCVIEDSALLDTVARFLVRLRDELDIEIVFKASFDKANRTSIHSFRGVGIEQGTRCPSPPTYTNRGRPKGSPRSRTSYRFPHSYADRPTCWSKLPGQAEP